jgi:RNA recognition motif-containing protein
MKLYVGSLDFQTTQKELEDLFATVGQVESVNIITDKYSGRSKGFGFVEMPDEAKAKEAISTLNGKTLGGRMIMVNEARPKKDRNSGGGNFRKERW